MTSSNWTIASTNQRGYDPPPNTIKRGTLTHLPHFSVYIHSINMKYRCLECGEEFSDEDIYLCHTELFHNNSHLCEVCGEVFNNEAHYICHLEIFHNAVPMDVDEDFELFPEENVNIQERPSVIQRAPPLVNPAQIIPLTIVSSGQALENSVVKHFRILNDQLFNLEDFMTESKELIKTQLREELLRIHFIKFGLLLDTTFFNVNEELSNRGFICRNRRIIHTTELDSVVEECFQELLLKITEHEARGSGWSLKSIVSLDLRVHKSGYGDRGSSFIPLPASIANTLSCVNVQNNDNECFRYALLAKHITNGNAHRVDERYERLRHEYDFAGLKYPVNLSKIKLFERRNRNVSVNVFGLDSKNNVYPLKVVDHELRDHTDLLLITDDKVSHYVFIKDFNKLLRRQLTKHRNAITVCKRCFNFKNVSLDTGGRRWLNEHLNLCGKTVPVKVVLPRPKNSILKFKKTQQQYKIPIVIYADFESTLISNEITDPDSPANSKYQKHEPNSYCLLVKSNLPEDLLRQYGIPTNPQLYRGTEVSRKFVSSLYDIAAKVSVMYSNIVPMKRLTDLQELAHLLADRCYLCNEEYTIENYKVHDHNHLTGEYNGPCHTFCNLQYKIPKFLPVVLHNLSGYDGHFIIPELGRTDGSIDVLAQTTEKFISFTKKVGNIKLKFLDSLRFMPSSLMKLSQALSRQDLIETKKLVSDNLIELVLRKGVFPYDYVDSINKFEETSLPPKEAFYNRLENQHIEDEDYAHAVRVWNELGMTTLGEYSDFYVKLDVTLLCDVMEEFRNACMTSYGLDPFHFYTSPGLAWQAMMKETKCELALLTDIDMLLMIENGVRGGLVQSVVRYIKANNKHVPNNDPNKESVYIGYFDANNLYGWAMSMPLPYTGFMWKDPNTLGRIADLPREGDIGYILDFDFEYPDHLHEQHFDLPLLPRSEIPPGGKHPKLLTTVENKANYVAHYWLVQQALDLGIKVVRVNRVLQFYQKRWLQPYIDSNTRRRANATSNFHKDFFKMMNNAVYGKTLENKRNHMNLKLVNDSKKLEKLVAKPNFKTSVIINENLVAVCMAKTSIYMDRPVYVGMTVLDISKTHMYEFHYKKMLDHYGRNKICIAYMDTDAFVYEIKTEDMYEDLKTLPFRDDFDLSDYPTDHPAYDFAVNKKLLGKFKDETCSIPIKEFVALRPKMYAMKLCKENEDTIVKAKGIKRSYLKNSVTFDHYYKCLFEGLETTAEFNTIRSFNHQLYSVRLNKKFLSINDDKRVILQDNVHTLPHGHFKFRA